MVPRILIILGILAVVSLSGCISETGNIISKYRTLAPDEIKSHAVQVSYDELFRNIENYVGDIVYFKGQVIQVLGESDYFDLRVAVTDKGFYWDDPVYVSYQGKRLLEGDIIKLWASVDGLITYTAVMGNWVTIPKLTALIVELYDERALKDSDNPYDVNKNNKANIRNGTLTIERVNVQLANLYSTRVTVRNTGSVPINPRFDIYVYKGNQEVCSGSPFLEDFDTIEPGEKKTGEIDIIGCVLEEDGTYYIKIDLLDSDYNRLDTAMKIFEVNYWGRFQIS